MIGRLTRLLGLLVLVLCTLVPADVRARMAEACRESDNCACRKGEHADTEQQPTARRIDCCAAPCEIDITSTSANVPQHREFGLTQHVTLLPEVAVAAPTVMRNEVARRGGRGPPLRLHALVQRWLV